MSMALAESSYNSSGESEGETVATSAAEWIGITTNSEECSYSSDIDDLAPNTNPDQSADHPFAWEFQIVITFESSVLVLFEKSRALRANKG